jgi:hypothetical protein
MARSKKGKKKMKPIRIPLKYDEAVSAFLKVKPEPKKPKTNRKD